MRAPPDRRHRRSHDPIEALTLQLEACRRAAGLDGMVLSDADGLCLAAAGDRAACDEIAAQLPLIGQKIAAFEGVLLSDGAGWAVGVRRFAAASGELYLAAIGGSSIERDRELGRGLDGAARILAAA
jgi:hypothetical protein